MNREIPVKERSIALIGFMGVGKTTIGKLVAKRLCRDFVDIDEEIEKEFRMPVTEIFKRHGEEVFRKKEKEMIANFAKKKLNVLSLGGGAFMQEEVRRLCMENCLVFYLELSWEAWKKRLEFIFDSRPVLHGKSLEEMKQLFEERKKIYAHHHSRVLLDNLDSETAADQIVKTVKLAWEMDGAR